MKLLAKTTAQEHLNNACKSRRVFNISQLKVY